jgi:hypothetical protein
LTFQFENYGESGVALSTSVLERGPAGYSFVGILGLSLCNPRGVKLVNEDFDFCVGFTRYTRLIDFYDFTLRPCRSITTNLDGATHQTFFNVAVNRGS